MPVMQKLITQNMTKICRFPSRIATHIKWNFHNTFSNNRCIHFGSIIGMSSAIRSLLSTRRMNLCISKFFIVDFSVTEFSVKESSIIAFENIFWSIYLKKLPMKQAAVFGNVREFCN